jgi:hypothetical protein
LYVFAFQPWRTKKPVWFEPGSIFGSVAAFLRIQPNQTFSPLPRPSKPSRRPVSGGICRFWFP